MRIIEANDTFKYQMLSRLKSDCEYCIKTAKSTMPLWGSTVEKHIAEMRRLFNTIKEKPEWITMKDIDYYEKELKKLEHRS